MGLALWLVATAAFAGRVVVFDLAGDRKARLRGQIEAAVRHAHSAELVPLSTYEKAAAREGFQGRRAFTPAAFQQVAGALHLTLAVGGAVASSFYVRFLDAHGQELWSKELQAHKGLISPANAQRLAKAIGVAVRQAEAQQEPAAQPETTPSAPADEIAAAGNAGGAKAPEAYQDDGAQTGVTASGSAPQNAPTTAPAPNLEPGKDTASPPPASALSPSTATAAQTAPALPEPIPEGPPAFVPRPHLITVMLLGSTTFRSYCARPGVSSCADYDAQDPGARQPGPTVDFSPQVPYGGFDLGLQLFPFARLTNAARGIGVFGEYHRGFELTKVRQQAQDGQTPDTQANSTDAGYRVEGVWRWYFARGQGEPLVGYLGGRVGYISRAFDVDKSISAILPGAHHRGPVLAADFGYPLTRWFRAELSAELYPHLIPGSGETVGFGTSGSGSAYGFQIGPAGELWGPLGYYFHLRYLHLTDDFEGQGVAWQNGGVTEETYLTLQWGATIQF